MNSYQAGDLNYYSRNDPVFDTLEAARTHLRNELGLDDQSLGIWDYATGELLEIWHDGELFVKE